MNKRFIKQLLTLILAIAISFTSVVPSYAMEPGDPGYESSADNDDEDEQDQGNPDAVNPDNNTSGDDKLGGGTPVEGGSFEGTPVDGDSSNSDNTKKTVSVTLNANGGVFENGEDTYVITVEENASIADSVVAPVKEDAEFTGWFSDAEAKELVDLSTYTAVDGTVLYAGYGDNDFILDSNILVGSTFYAMILDANGGTFRHGNETERLFKESRTLENADFIPTREGYAFTGWYAEKECTTLLSESSNPNNYSRYYLKETPAERTTIYAGWCKYNTTTFIFGSDNGSEPTDTGYYWDSREQKQYKQLEVKVPVGQGIVGWFISNDEVRNTNAAYSFSGWYSDEERTSKIEDYDYDYFEKHVPTGDETYYAGFESTTDTVITFHINDSDAYFKKNRYDTYTGEGRYDAMTVSVSKWEEEIVIDDNLILNVVTENVKKSLVGWYKDADCKDPVLESATGKLSVSDIKNQNITDIYAKWETKYFEVKFDANGGYFQDGDAENTSKTTVEVSGLNDTETTFTPGVVKNKDLHLRFMGWSTVKNASEAQYAASDDIGTAQFATKITEDTTFYAVWNNVYSVATLDAGNGTFFYYDRYLGFRRAASKVQVRRDENGALKDFNLLREPVANDPKKGFDGWYYNNKKLVSGLFSVSTACGKTGDVTISVRYADAYVVTFDANGGYFATDDGEEVLTCSKSVIKGKWCSLQLWFPYTHKDERFYDWYYDKECTKPVHDEGLYPKGDMTLYAGWDDGTGKLFENATYDIFYNLYDGTNAKTNPASYTLKDGTIELLPATKLDNTFAGWYTYENNEKKALTPDDAEHPTKYTYTIKDTDIYGITFYAEWVPADYKLTFDTNSDGEVAAPASIEHITRGQIAPAEMNGYDYQLRRTGYIFDGWYLEKNLKSKIVPGNTKLPAAVTDESGYTVYAKWTDVTYVVNFHSNLVKDTKNTVTYQISKDGQTMLDPQTIFGKTVVTDEMAKSFDGWLTSTIEMPLKADNTVKDLITYYDNTGAKVTVDVYAQWKDTDYYTVKFIAGNVDEFDPADFRGSDFTVNSDDDLIQYETVYVGQKLALTGTEFVRKGYTLTGWTYTASNGRKTTIKPTDTVVNLVKAGETVELTANWNGPESYTVKFDYNGGKYTGKDKLPAKYTYANPYALPDASQMYKAGYTFAGWIGTANNTSRNSTVIGKGGEIEKDNVTLKADWTLNHYNFELDPNGGWTTPTGYEKRTQTNVGYLDQWLLKGVTYSRPGYKFVNWSYVDDNGKTKTIASNGTLTKLTTENGKTVTVTANWSPLSYSITYSLGSGAKQVGAPRNFKGDIKGDGTDLRIPDPTRVGYTFAGWTLTQKGVAAGSETATLTSLESGYTLAVGSYGNVILTANWTPTKYKFAIKDAEGNDVAPGWMQKTQYPYDATIDFTRVAGEISDALVGSGKSSGKSVKGFALNEKDANRGAVKYGLAKNFKISDLVNATKATDTITLYVVTEKEKFFLNVYNYVDDACDDSSYRTYNYDQTRNYKVPTPSMTGYAFKGWKAYVDGQVKDLSVLGTKGIDYEVDKNNALTIKKHVNGPNAFRSATLAAVFETKNYEVILVPNAKDVYAKVDENSGIHVAQAGITYTENDVVKEFKHSDNTAALAGVDWSRTGYTLAGFSLSAKGAVLDGGADAKVGGLFPKADRNGNVKLYAIWTANTKTVIYDTEADVFADTDAVKGKTDGDYTGTILIGQEVNSLNNSYKAFTFGKAINLPSIKKTGYKFLGWKQVVSNTNVAENKAGYATKINAANTEEVILRAEFEEVTYKLSLNPNGGYYNGSNKTVVLKDKVRYSEDISAYLPTADKFSKSRNNLLKLFGTGSFYGFAAKAPTSINSTAAYQKWLDGFKTSEGGYVLNSTGARTLFPQWSAQTFTQPTNVKAKYDSGILDVSWSDASSDVDEFDVCYSTSPTFLYSVYYKRVSGNERSTYIEGLTGSKYYVRVREVKAASNDTMNGGTWSAVVSAAADTTQYQTLKVAHKIDAAAPMNAADRRAAVGQSLIQALAAPKYAGYYLEGWYTDAECTVKVAENALVSGDESSNKYYALFKPSTFKLSFNWGAGVSGAVKLNPVDVTYTETYPELPGVGNAKKTGYHFVGWQIGDQEIKTGETINVKADTTATAVWEPDEYEVSFVIMFDDGKTDNPDPITVTYGSAYGELPVIERQGCTFKGWYTSSYGGTMITETSKVTIPKDHKLYAQWNSGTYEISFNANAPEGTTATGSMTPETRKTIDLKELKANKYKVPGYRFVGWKINDDSQWLIADKARIKAEQLLINGAQPDANNNITLYAQWEQIDYQLTLNIGNDQDRQVVVAHYGDNVLDVINANVVLPEYPDRKVGMWYTNPKTGPFSKVADNAVVIGDATYYALWYTILYNVYFDQRNGEDSIISREERYGTNVYELMDRLGVPKIPTNGNNVNATFGGWYMQDENGQRDGKGVKVDENTTLPNQDVTFYAYWIY